MKLVRRPINRYQTCRSFPSCQNVACQFVTYLDTNCLLPSAQSGFQLGHWTETAIIHVLSNRLDAGDRVDTTMLVHLNLCTAFDTADHGILLKRLQVTFSVDGSTLAWFRSYLAGRQQHVLCGGKCSALTDVIYGVPQGSVLGSILFILYPADLASIVAEHGLLLHQYADDSQIYGSSQSDATLSLSNTVSLRVDSISLTGCAQTASNSVIPYFTILLQHSSVTLLHLRGLRNSSLF